MKKKLKFIALLHCKENLSIFISLIMYRSFVYLEEKSFLMSFQTFFLTKAHQDNEEKKGRRKTIKQQYFPVLNKTNNFIF